MKLKYNHFNRNVTYLGLAYQTYKVLLAQKDVERRGKGIINKEYKEEVKKTDEQVVRIIMKW